MLYFLSPHLTSLSPLPICSLSPSLTSSSVLPLLILFETWQASYTYVPHRSFLNSLDVRPLCPLKYYLSLSLSFSPPRSLPVYAFKTFVKGGLIDKTIARRGLNTAFKGALLNCRQEGEG